MGPKSLVAQFWVAGGWGGPFGPADRAAAMGDCARRCDDGGTTRTLTTPAYIRGDCAERQTKARSATRWTCCGLGRANVDAWTNVDRAEMPSFIGRGDRI